ncbi:MAG TPA: MBL fold metallo-hydrolase [Candidatus Sulfopaludibacter sp.]|nr:MBL fold metallo-hydrolase [Candidatus Sulfopaludibacter sp.]
MRDRIVLGNFEVALIRDSVYWWDGGAIFGVVPKTLWSRHTACDELNRIPLAFNCYLIRTDDHTILIETGGGDKMDGRFRERTRLPAEREPMAAVVARHGIDPESIDIVINSHLHWDHCSGNTVLLGERVEPAFPRARYYVARGEWEHAHERHPRDRVSYIDANYDPLVESGQMTLVDPEYEVAPGVRMRHAPGHNRDMCVVTAESNGETFCFVSDLVPLAAQLPPTWVAGVDLYPVQNIETKTRVLTQAIEENWVCGFGHDPQVAFARLEWHQSAPRVAAA